MDSVESLFDLTEAVKWIKNHSFKCVALQLPVYLLKYSVQLTQYLELKLNSNASIDQHSSSHDDRLTFQSIEFYTIVLNSCSIDYVSPRHLNGQVDAVIRFGKCCLASLPNGIVEYPVLFMFERHYLNEKANDFMSNYLKNELNSTDALLVIDTNFLIPTLELIRQSKLNIPSAKFIKFTSKWTFIDNLNDQFVDLICSDDRNEVENVQFYNYCIDQKLSDYKRIYYVGDRVPNSIKILSLLEVFHLNPSTQTVTHIQTNRELMKRCSLIEKVKKLTRFGVVFTHAYPNVNPYIEEIKQLIKRKKKQVNFITLVQTTDEFKLGNFSALDSLILVSNCYCSYLIDTVNLHIPLINYEEFKISCGLRIEYGQVKWNEDLEDELICEKVEQESNELLLDDRNTALVESYLKDNKWFGLQVNAGQDEISDLKQGMKGIAMGYQSKSALESDFKTD